MILIFLLIISVGLFSFNMSTGTVTRSELDITELQAFNSNFEQYQGLQYGTNVKTLISYLITNAGSNMDNDNKLPDITFIDFDNSEFIIISTTSDIGVQSMSQLRYKIDNNHNYQIEMEYNFDGYISDIIITY